MPRSGAARAARLLELAAALQTGPDLDAFVDGLLNGLLALVSGELAS